MHFLRRMRDGGRGLGRRHPSRPRATPDDPLTLEQLHDLPYDIALSWEYEPTAPFHVRVLPAERPMIGCGNFETIENAVAYFNQAALPLRAGWMASITDLLGVIVVGYNTIPLDSVGGDWVGVRWGFIHLERSGQINPVDLAIYETRAREAIG